MKKSLFIFFLSILFVPAFSQTLDPFFENKTLRIDYLRIGKNDFDSIAIQTFHVGDEWTGTSKHLVESSRLGDILFLVTDAKSSKLIYSRSYSTLFSEYATTERAETEIGSFEEVVLMPFPKAAVNFSFIAYNRKNVATLLYKGSFDPQKDKCLPYTEEYKVLNLHIGGKPEDCMDILFIPDGYSKVDKQLLKKDMKRFAEYIINCRPYKDNLSRINIRAIEGYSEESGITDPNKNVYKKTLLNCSYNSIEVDRYMMCLNVWELHDVAEDAPYDVIVIIGNSPKYGGGGIYNFYASVNSDNTSSNYVIVHEMGHSIAGLGDEYYTSEVSVRDFYPEGIEPVEPNLTTLVDFDKKWKSMLSEEIPIPTLPLKQYKETLGVYEGGGYVAEGVYRPMQDCTMKSIIYDYFCPVCTKALIETFNFYSK